MNEETFEQWFKDKCKYSLAPLDVESAWNHQQEKIDNVLEELEIERASLSVCGVVALANTKESAKRQRQISDKYKSASLTEVINAVDREMQYREEVDAQAKELKALRGFANSAIEEFDEETWISSIAKK